MNENRGDVKAGVRNGPNYLLHYDYKLQDTFIRFGLTKNSSGPSSVLSLTGARGEICGWQGGNNNFVNGTKKTGVAKNSMV